MRELCAAADRSGRDGRTRPEVGETNARRARRGRLPARGPPRCTSPGAGIDGRSLAECTATSARPSSTADCTSLTNTPCPPISWIGRSRVRSPSVSTMTSSTSIDASSAATAHRCVRLASERGGCLAWRSAPARRADRLQGEEVAQCFGEPLAARGAGDLLQAHRRLVQQLRDDAPSDGLDAPRARSARAPRGDSWPDRARPRGRRRPTRAWRR